MTVASFRSAGCGIMIEDNPDQKIQSKRYTDAPLGVWLENFLPRATQNVYILKTTFGNLHGNSRVCTQFVGSKRADNCPHRQQVRYTFFQTKAIPPALWNPCDYVLQFTFRIAHIAGSVNTAADFVSRLELNVTEKIRLKIRQDIQTTPIEVTISSSDVADEEQFFLTHADNNDESKEQTPEPKEQSRQNPRHCVTYEDPSSWKASVKEFTKIDGNTTSHSMNGIKTNARKRVEQDVNLVLKTWNWKF